MNGGVEIADLGANTLLIIGNGFDLDLGLNTRYSDFANSELWPFKRRLFGLGGYLNRHRYSDTWFDLESSMADYCEKAGHIMGVGCLFRMLCEKDEQDDQTLNNALCNYLAEETQRIGNEIILRRDSTAAKILHVVCSSVIPGTIFTFNYTNLKSIAKALNPDLEVGCNPHYVHGELCQKSIILGFNERHDIPEFYKRFFKNRRSGYSSTSLFRSIEQYDNIVFHGLSFGEIDNVYFVDFFKKIANKEMEGKYIRIMTKDNNSRQIIFEGIQKMIGSTQDLYTVADFKIVTTDGKMDNDINDLITRLSQNCSGDL